MISIAELVASVTAVTNPAVVSLMLMLSPPALVILSLPSVVAEAAKSPIEAVFIELTTSDNSSAAVRSTLVPFIVKILPVTAAVVVAVIAVPAAFAGLEAAAASAALSAKTWGFYDVLFKGNEFKINRELNDYVMENILFKIGRLTNMESFFLPFPI